MCRDLSFSRTGAELLSQVITDQYERRSLLITSNLTFSDWGQVFQGEAKAETPNSGLHPNLKKASLSR